MLQTLKKIRDHIDLTGDCPCIESKFNGGFGESITDGLTTRDGDADDYV